jgi:hypothetical protein
MKYPIRCCGVFLLAREEDRMFLRAKLMGAAALLATAMLTAPMAHAQNTQQVTIDGAR